MFCPRCGQQAAEEVSFCSRCGLPLGAAAGLVASGGRPAEGEPAAPLTPRQRGVRKGLLITAGGVIFCVLVAILMTVKEDFFPFLILGGLIMTAGVMRMLYGLLLEEHTPRRKPPKRDAAADARATLGRAGAGELPPARSVPASVYARPGADTSDMAASPLSVTEGTTRLLEEEEGRDRR
ncbi:MAG TPA: zinc-ribbon domain-containing protein [Pyrinomonadaceae bacterium]|jgi:hypothetical protein